MGRIIIKPDRDIDYYVEWSTIVESPITAGTREKLTEIIGGFDIAARLNRADRYGTSSRIGSGNYDDVGLITTDQLPGQRWLPRAKLRAFTEAILARESEAALSMTEPIED